MSSKELLEPQNDSGTASKSGGPDVLRLQLEKLRAFGPEPLNRNDLLLLLNSTFNEVALGNAHAREQEHRSKSILDTLKHISDLLQNDIKYQKLANNDLRRYLDQMQPEVETDQNKATSQSHKALLSVEELQPYLKMLEIIWRNYLAQILEEPLESESLHILQKLVLATSDHDWIEIPIKSKIVQFLVAESLVDVEQLEYGVVRLKLW